MWTPICLLLVLAGTTCVQGEEVQINKGTIIEKVGDVILIENMVIIKKNITEKLLPEGSH